jgi:HEAT repeat protein
VAVIRRLEGEWQEKARKALVSRLSRLAAGPLLGLLQDNEPELRRAAALACARRDAKTYVPPLIPLLRDRDEDVAAAARAALKELSGRDLGADADAWQAWWDRREKR